MYFLFVVNLDVGICLRWHCHATRVHGLVVQACTIFGLRERFLARRQGQLFSLIPAFLYSFESGTHLKVL